MSGNAAALSTVPAVPAGVSVEAVSSADEWDVYVERHPDATVDHRWAWRDIFARALGHDAEYLAARRGGRLVGVLPLVCFNSRLFGRSVVSVPCLNYGGLLVDDAQAGDALVARAGEVAAEFGASWVELRHTARRCPALPYRQHKVAMTRRLPASADALWSETDRKVRNQVRKAQKEGLVAQIGGPELLDEFYRVFAENMRDLGTPVYGRRLFDEVVDRFGAEARVFVVRAGATPAAAAIALGFRDTILVPWASSLRRFRASCPNMLLYWTMIEWTLQQGRRVFDFGRSSPEGGTYHFKLQWGATPMPLYWEYILRAGASPPDHGPGNPAFRTVINLWRRLPVSVATAIGPSIVRHIP